MLVEVPWMFFDEDPVGVAREPVSRRAGKRPRMEGRHAQVMPTEGSICVQRVAWYTVSARIRLAQYSLCK